MLSVRLSTTDANSGARDNVAVVGLLLWLGWRWAPFRLHVNLGAFKAALAPFVHPQFDGAHCLHYLLWWTVAAQMLFAVANRARGSENLLVLIAVVLSGRLFLVDAPLQVSELAALLLLLPVLVVLHKFRSGLRNVALLLAFVAVYAWDSLSPWSFDRGVSNAVSHFDFWPFVAWFNAGMPIDLTWLLHRLFMFAAAMWLVLNVGLSARFTVFAITGVALLVECLQAWLPHRSGSLTEPALALILTLSLRWLAESSASRPHVRSR
jgi:hypothetical protein